MHQSFSINSFHPTKHSIHPPLCFVPTSLPIITFSFFHFLFFLIHISHFHISHFLSHCITLRTLHARLSIQSPIQSITFTFILHRIRDNRKPLPWLPAGTRLCMDSFTLLFFYAFEKHPPPSCIDMIQHHFHPFTHFPLRPPSTLYHFLLSPILV